jgi:hypothetical protein
MSKLTKSQDHRPNSQQEARGNDKIDGLNRSNLIALKQITYFVTKPEVASLFESCNYEGEGNSIMANAGLIASALLKLGLMEKSRPEFAGINKKGYLAVVLANKDYCDIDRGDTVVYWFNGGPAC